MTHITIVLRVIDFTLYPEKARKRLQVKIQKALMFP